LVYLSDRSAESIELIVKELHPLPEHGERIATILGKAKNLYLLRHKGQLCGFINIKPHPAKSVVYCPLYYMGDSSHFMPGEVVGQIKQLFPESKAIFCVFITFLNVNIDSIWAAHKPWDTSIGMRLEAKDMHCVVYRPEQVVCEIEEIAYDELLALHQQAYASEPEYVMGEWDELLEQFYTSPNHTIVSCRLQGGLIGACLGYQQETEHYIYSVCLLPQHTGKGMGRYMLERYLFLIQSPVYSLSVMTNNLAAKQLYEKLGFTRTSENFAVYRFDGSDE
jgi:ribosomal protein S18 acetylase RimI-like enzyme